MAKKRDDRQRRRLVLGGFLLVVVPFLLAAMVLVGIASAGAGAPVTITPSHASGWYQSSLTLTWTVTGNPTSTRGCDPVTIGESPIRSYRCTARTPGPDTRVTVDIGVDLTNPSLADPPDIGPLPATGPDGRVVDYPLPTATDNLSAPTVACNPSPGFEFPVGTTTVNCTAADASGRSASADFTVTISPQGAANTPPTVTVSGPTTVAAESPAGAVVAYTVSVADAEDDPDPPFTCPGAPASGSTFPVGTTTFTCSATDSGGLSGTSGYEVTVTAQANNLPPIITVPASMTVEANGPGGAVVNYPPATSTDSASAPLQATCFPPSGATFPLGTWLVECSATDSAGQVGTASFSVRVVDRQPPVLTIPASLAIQSSGPVAASDARIQAFLGGATATDIVDPNPAVTTNAPSSFPVGVTTVTFTARDDAGNTTQKNATVTVSPDPVGPQTPGDTAPPNNVSNVRAILGNLAVSLSWKPPAKDFDHVAIVQSPGRGGNGETVVYSGKKSSFVAKGLTKGVEYRFVLIAFDKAGNRAAGVAVVALAQAQTLLAPANGAVISNAPLIKWKPVKGTRYYNAQIWHEGAGGGKALLAGKALRKVLSVWPTKPSFKMKKTWRFAGKRFSLQPGRYLLYIWPGIGAKAAGRYGKMIVQAEFTFRKS